MNTFNVLSFSSLDIQTSLSKIEKNIDEVGILTFLRFFEKNPHAKTKFHQFSEVEIKDLRGSDVFRSHASRIIATLKRVTNMSNNTKSYNLH